MPIILDGTAGIDNDATDLSYTGTLTGGTGVVNLGSGQVYKDASGNVGIGTSLPQVNLQIGNADNASRSIVVHTANNGDARLRFREGGTVGSGFNEYSFGMLGASNAMTWESQGLGEVARIDSSGNLLVGTTTPLLATPGFSVQPAGNGANVPFAVSSGASSSASHITWAVYSSSLLQYQFYVNYAGTVLARSTSISALSDQREKENIRPLETGLTEVMALQPRRFDWKNGSGSNVAGFIAQEVEAVLPDLIDEYQINDEETRMAVKMGDILPTLVKAVQELKAINDAQAQTINAQQAALESLTARVVALEQP